MSHYKIYCSLFLACIAISVELCTSAKRLTTFEKDITLSLGQKEILDKFKDLVQGRLPHEYMKENIYLIKFLRYKNFNMAEAEKFLMEVLQWRNQQNIDTIHLEDWSDMKKRFKYNLQMKDRDGEPVLYFDVGGMDIRKIVLQGEERRFNRYVDGVIEEACTFVRTLGTKYQNITRGHLIINAKGYNLVEQGCLRCIPSLLRIVISYEQHWPECVDKILVMNAPEVAIPLIDAAKILLHSSTRQSLSVHGTNKNKNLQTLSKYFDMEEISIELGGRKVLDNADEEDDDNYTY